MEYQVILTPLARRDLASIEDYLLEKAPEEAAPFCYKLLDRSSSLRTFPARYPKLRFNPNVHQLTFGNYSIIFGIETSKHLVKVYRFWHTAQSPRRFRLQEVSPRYSAVTQASP